MLHIVFRIVFQYIEYICCDVCVVCCCVVCGG